MQEGPVSCQEMLSPVCKRRQKRPPHLQVQSSTPPLLQLQYQRLIQLQIPPQLLQVQCWRATRKWSLLLSTTSQPLDTTMTQLHSSSLLQLLVVDIRQLGRPILKNGQASIGTEQSSGLTTVADYTLLSAPSINQSDPTGLRNGQTGSNLVRQVL